MGRIADGLTDEPTPRRNKVDRILDELDDDDRVIVEGWLCDGDMGARPISDKLHAYGIELSPDRIWTWRRRNGIRWVA